MEPALLSFRDKTPGNHAPHTAHSAAILCDGSATLSVSGRADGTKAVHRPSGRERGKAEQFAVPAGISAVPERALPAVLRGMFRLSFRAHRHIVLSSQQEPETRHAAQRASCAAG